MDKPKTKIILLILFALFFKFGFEITYSIVSFSEWEYVENGLGEELENEVDDELKFACYNASLGAPDKEDKLFIIYAQNLEKDLQLDLYTPPPEVV